MLLVKCGLVSSQTFFMFAKCELYVRGVFAVLVTSQLSLFPWL